MTQNPQAPVQRLADQPTARTFRVEALVRLVNQGQMRVPDFQRRFRWATSDVVALFDSLLRGFPVGNLLLWRKPDNPVQQVRLGELSIAAPQGEALWVVDGQQRVTSLVNAVSEDAFATSDRFALVYDLAEKRVVARAAAGASESVPLPVLFDLRRLLAWMQEHPELSDDIVTLNDVATTLRDVEIPASIVDTADDLVLRDIFDRTNNAGKRLSRAEVFSALAGATSTDVPELTLTAVAEQVDAVTRFGMIDDDTVLRAVLACRGTDVEREIRDEFTSRGSARSEFPDDQRRAYARAAEALSAAVAFFQRDVGVPHFAFLPYRYVLVVLTRFFAHFPHPHPRNRHLLVRWTWLALLRGPQISKGNTAGAARTLCGSVHPRRESGSVQDLLSVVTSAQPPALPDLSRFKTNDASTRVLLCALWSLGPRSLDTGEVTSIDQLADALGDAATALGVVFDIVPPGRLKTPRVAANRLVAVPDEADVARRLLRGQADLFSDGALDDEVFASHAISRDARAALEAGDDAAFLTARTATLSRLLVDLTSARTGQGLEVTPPLDDLDLDEESDERDDAFASHSPVDGDDVG